MRLILSNFAFFAMLLVMGAFVTLDLDITNWHMHFRKSIAICQGLFSLGSMVVSYTSSTNSI